METSAQQALKASKLAVLIGAILDDYIRAQEIATAETSGNFLLSAETLLQDVESYRERFESLVGLSPEPKRLAELQAYIEQRREERDA